MSLSFPFDSRIVPKQFNPDRRKGASNYTSRQNDPAYHREVQYTYADRTVRKFSAANVYEIVRLLCKDQGLQFPDHLMYSFTGVNLIYTLETLNGIVESAMSQTVPLPKYDALKTV